MTRLTWYHIQDKLNWLGIGIGDTEWGGELNRLIPKWQAWLSPNTNTLKFNKKRFKQKQFYFFKHFNNIFFCEYPKVIYSVWIWFPGCIDTDFSQGILFLICFENLTTCAIDGNGRLCKERLRIDGKTKTLISFFRQPFITAALP